MFFYMKYSYIILKEYEKRFWVKESHFLGVVVELRFENSSYNFLYNSENPFLCSLLDICSKLNHVNHCVFCIFYILFSLIFLFVIVLCRGFSHIFLIGNIK